MKALNTNLPNNNINLTQEEYEELEEIRNPRLNGKKMDRRRPVQNWKKVWSEHLEDYDEVDDFYEH